MCCDHGSSFNFLPATLSFHIGNFPNIYVDPDLDRALLRCRLCDGEESQEQANLAEEEGLELMADLKTRISEIEEWLASGILTEDLTKFPPQMKRKLSAAARDTDKKILDCGKPYWAVWGPGDGPEMDHEIFEGDEEDFQLEFPTKEEIEIASEPPKEEEKYVPELLKSSERKSSIQKRSFGQQR
ncbi:hypothetical protein BUE80_DR003678 [Diplocarpon rosae]|nr:hypothetical protein BUE80_DR003678 [Diplocarpon rosae]